MANHTLLLALLSFAAADEQPAWHRFATNKNYRLTGLLDINGGQNSNTQDRTPGYSVPIEVLTLYNNDNDKYHQRISYYSGTYVEYNINGAAYAVVPTPYGRDYNVSGSRICFHDDGNETDKVPYLNFFPTVKQMRNYTVGDLITNEAGIPYRKATLEASHGSHDAIQTSSEIPSDYESGMPSNDWFEVLYQESLSASAITSSDFHAIPLKWTMLARNQIINAHTEHWVLRYLSYEAIDSDDEWDLWNDWNHFNFDKDCNDESAMDLAEGHTLKMNRLGMFFSSSSKEEERRSTVSSAFDVYTTLTNKHYSTNEEYNRRKSIHDANVNKIQQLNKNHAGRTSFVHNEFMDLELEEVMQFRGGHIAIPHLDEAKGAAGIKSHSRNSLRRLTSSEEETIDDYNFTVYKVPDDFDPSTLPNEFDWRTHMPGSISPIKDQGFCGSCWAFSFIASLESHWFITNSQSVRLPEQFVNDCLWSEYSFGCDGGQSYVAAVAALEKFGGAVPTVETYGSYLSIDGQCYVDILQGLGMLHGKETFLSQTQPSTVRMTDWVILPERDEVAIKHALLNKGPLSVGFNVVDESLYYSNGVLDVDSCTANTRNDMDHAINLIGWGVDTMDDGTEAQHWILRNSWSTVWGDGGYFRVRMGERDCGVSSDAGFPVVEQIDRTTAVE